MTGQEVSLKEVSLKEVLTKIHYSYYSKDEIDHVQNKAVWIEKSEDEKRLVEIYDDRDGDLIKPDLFRMWETKTKPGEIIWTVIMYESGLIELGDEMVGIGEETDWRAALDGYPNTYFESEE